MMYGGLQRVNLIVVALFLLANTQQCVPGCHAFTTVIQRQSQVTVPTTKKPFIRSLVGGNVSGQDSSTRLWMASSGPNNEKDEELKAVEEESRLKILKSRRDTIRSTLKGSESLANFRIANGYIPEIDEETGKPVSSDGKTALTWTAFAVAFGAVALRVGGRAALVSSLGLDFVTNNPALKENLDQVLAYAANLNVVTETLGFVAAWTVVKVFCFDAGGVALALSSGIIFGGVLQGAFMSALAATIGSSVAFGLAKLDTPLRQKALDIVEENPSLRGVERVVAQDGMKAILTLRLAPILPIPIGMYNYIYAVTNVPFFDFAGGIFFGSFKPYLLDSYLGFFGMSLMDGTAAEGGGMEDYILLVALGVSVLIGVFASQLAGETWESVTEEVNAEQRAKLEAEGGVEDEDDGMIRELFGVKLPLFLVGMQLGFKDAEERISDLILVEYDAQVWNYTKADGGPPREKDPAFSPESPEIDGANKGFDFGASVCDGLVLSPLLFKAALKYSDPFYSKETDLDLQFIMKQKEKLSSPKASSMMEPSALDSRNNESRSVDVPADEVIRSMRSTDDELLATLAQLREIAETRSKELDDGSSK
eukprot:CAMPEP_0198294862 /NCGR_PEP_ID=MMETSP1449-20131203/24687_1 /TAXON_ID=420275 /ORGANISM="Attheya septentrionalis, Strain CCMP2084" /LENGTH=593 /DNA_ID=CAMNT_0043994957 /DNA_START=267 /DNA_END=2048 /DNA_ORIENTATION=-